MTTESQSAGAVLMIRPVRFQTNPLTAASNRFQRERPVDPPEISQARALVEFERLRRTLEDAGVEVCAFDDTPEPHTPDSIFPNNWVSFHADGSVVVYPMEAENRRPERRADVIEALGAEHGFRIERIVDLSGHEKAGRYLESTGSLVLDRPRRIAYACLSSRTHLEPLADFARQLDYEVVAFDALDSSGQPIYHTNVMMWVGEGLAAIGSEAIVRADQRAAILARLAEGGRRIIELSAGQLRAFAGNMLELSDRNGDRLIVMSEQAQRSLETGQRAIIEDYARILAVPLEHIEACAGGSARCMLAAIHLPRVR